jgi:AraC-like DNA-binding protein
MKPISVRQIKSSQVKDAPNFSIRLVEELMGGNDMTQDLHRHNFYFILVLEKGKGTHEIDFESYPVEDRCIFFIRPGQVHRLTINAGSTGFLLEFNKEFYHLFDRNTSYVLRQCTGTNLSRVDREAFERLHSLLSNIFREYKDRLEGYQQIIKSNLDIFFIELVRHRKQDRHLSKGNAYEQERLEAFLGLIEKNIARQKQVSGYADAMNISLFQLNSITKTTLGKTASEVITDYIVLESKRYLMATTEQVSQIAFHLGFEDPSYFSRFFKKHTGYSPEDFRRNLR